MQNFLNKISSKITPDQKRLIVIILAIIGLLTLSYTYINNSKPIVRKKKEQPTSEVFTKDELGEKFGIQGLAFEIKELKKENEKLKRELDNLKTKNSIQDQQYIDPAKIEAKATEKALEIIKKQYGQKLKEIEERTKNITKLSGNQNATQANKDQKGKVTGSISMAKDDETCPIDDSCANKTSISPYDINWEKSSYADNELKEYGSSKTTSKRKKQEKTQSKSIKTIKGKQKTISTENQNNKENKQGTFIPAGSIFSGTLITGLDAPTSDAAKTDPFPILLRVKKEAILPNKFRADVRECFLIGSGWGDLSSERAYIRSERLSCVREDGNVIEVNIDMYAVGEDGKAGVRGRLVSKQGQLIGKALMAGFMEGFSNMFTSVPIPSLNTNPDENTLYQSKFSQKALESASLQGVGNALQRIADYYIQMAQNIFPVIEIDAGRAIDFIAVRGIRLDIK